MTAHVLACTIAALVAVAGTLALRGRRASFRHAILLLALLRFAVPTAWLTSAGSALPRTAKFDLAPTDLEWLLKTPRVGLNPPRAGGRPATEGIPILAILWGAGTAVCLSVWAWRARRGVPAVRPATDEERAVLQRVAGHCDMQLRIAAHDAMPGAWGWWRPCVILPDGLSTQLSEAELESVLAHEVAHVRRRDNLVAAIAHAIVSIFWFHPLVWWIERRMLAERETACDEFVLARGVRAEDYVAGILKVCRMSFAGSPRYAGVTGSNLGNRMEFIMAVDLNRPSSRAARALLGTFFALVAGLPVAGGYLSAQQNQTQPQAAAGAGEAAFRDGARLLREKKYVEAEQAFREAQRLEPAGTRGLMGQVEVKMAQGQWYEGLQLLQAEIDHDPTRLDLRMALGKAAARAGQYDQAIAVFQDAIGRVDKASKESGDLYLSLGEIHRRKGDVESAIADLRHAKEILPDNAAVNVTLALALDSAGKGAEAVRAYRTALKQDPNNAVALNNLAYLLSENYGDLDEALTLARRALELQPDWLEVSDTLGWIDLKLGRTNDAIAATNDAIAAFDRVVQGKPNDPTFRYHLGMALHQKGDNFAASEQLFEALKNHPPEELAQKIRQLLSALEQ